jgi:hypothetical protein
MTTTTTATAKMEPLRCQFCPRVYTLRGALAEAGARAAGWMVGEGPTLGGKHVRRVVCAVCLGRTEPEDDPLWDARCNTCGATAREDLGDEIDGALTEKDVKDWRDDHRCEPWVDLITPEQVQAENDRRRRRGQAVA